jgi:hypothetical protein
MMQRRKECGKPQDAKIERQLLVLQLEIVAKQASHELHSDAECLHSSFVVRGTNTRKLHVVVISLLRQRTAPWSLAVIDEPRHVFKSIVVANYFGRSYSLHQASHPRPFGMEQRQVRRWGRNFTTHRKSLHLHKDKAFMKYDRIGNNGS